MTISQAVPCEVGIVITALHTAIATAHDDELTDSTALDSLHDLVSKGKDLIVGEAADDLSVLDLLGSLALASHLDDLREVLYGRRGVWRYASILGSP